MKKTHWHLAVTHHPSAGDYIKLALGRDLDARIKANGVDHDSRKQATLAACHISKNPLVDNIELRRVEEVVEGIWRNGERTYVESQRPVHQAENIGSAMPQPSRPIGEILDPDENIGS